MLIKRLDCSLLTILSLALLNNSLAHPAVAVKPADHSYSKENATALETRIEVVPADVSALELMDPNSKAWNSAPGAKIKLYAQHVVEPYGGGATPELFVRAIKTGDGLIVRLQWDDNTRDDAASSSKFKDSVAVEFPLETSRSTILAMGHSRNPVNIWHWMAELEPRINKSAKRGGFADEIMPEAQTRQLVTDKLPQPGRKEKGRAEKLLASGVALEELVASGIYDRQKKPLQQLRGRGVWSDGHWAVTIYKPFDAGDSDSPNFSAASTVPMAFAVWNGSAGDRFGMKSVSNWTTMYLK